ncbi:MAG TPA: triose-phosphate isomerase [Gemmatimonadaceae bacterium]|jgi:triosephosphate isomerase|nr:triose-phosphate isomerase [Gemmatimonadaceae bacterium]
MTIFAANWKMHCGPRTAAAYMETFLAAHVSHPGRIVAFFPPATSLAIVAESIVGRDDLRVGAQNIFWEDRGAFTGEISAPMAREAGASWVLVGHSERRHVFGETLEDTARKCAAAVRAELTPMLCVGETLAEREAGDTARVVDAQLRAGVSAMTAKQCAHMLVAYEPVWAIGTGRHASPADAAEIHALLRALLDVATEGQGSRVPILYGGSVNAANVDSLVAAPNVDGVLVGGASLDPLGWALLAAT